MKFRNIIQSLKALGFLALSTVLFNACQKDLDLTTDTNNGDVLQDGSAKMRFIHVAPNLPGIAVLFNDNSVVGDSLRYKNKSDYTEVALGSTDNGFKINMISYIDSIQYVTDSIDTTVTPPIYYNHEEYNWTPNQEGFIANLQQTNYLLKKDVKYTCFVYDSTSYINFDNSRNVKHTILSDESPASDVVDTAWVRFYNLSATAGPVDLKITNNGNAQITTISNMSFLLLPVNTVLAPGNYNFEVTQGGTITSKNNIDIQNAKGYTFYLSGIKTASDDRQLELEYYTNGE